MKQPSVLAICLTANRAEMTRKAVASFRTQTYANKRMIVWDTGELDEDFDDDGEGGGEVVHVHAEAYAEPPLTIGALRNAANSFWNAYDIFVHFDSDDWSHPNRITEQVALLQASGADVVGYSEMLFWRTNGEFKFDESFGDGGFGAVAEDEDSISIETGALIECGEAWLYTSPVPKPTLGTSLCYWRKTWERKPFNPTLPNNRESLGEDTEFIRGLKVAAVSAVVKLKPGFKEHYAGLTEGAMTRTAPRDLDGEPRMIARIHGANSTRYNIEDARGTSWKRVPEWDARVREILEAN